MSDLLATPEDLASLLQRSDLDLATATLALEASTSIVQEAAGGQRILRVVDATYVIPVNSWSNYLRLPQRPLVSVTSVVLDGVTIAAGTAIGTYRIVGDRLYRSCGWLSTVCEPSLATIVATTGLAPGDQGLQLARSSALSIAAGAYENAVGATSEKIDDYAVTYAAASAAMAAAPALRAALRRQYGRRAGLVSI